MKTQRALAGAIVCGLLAVGLVAIDVATGLEVRLQERTESGWATVAAAPGARPRDDLYGACAGTDLRLVVDNDGPLAAHPELRVLYRSGGTNQVTTVLQDTWHLERFEARSHEFTIPAEAFQNDTADDGPRLDPAGVFIEAYVDGHYLSVCVQAEAAA